MSKIIPVRPKEAHVMNKGGVGPAHFAIRGFEPELPNHVYYGGVSDDRLELSDKEVEGLLRAVKLVLETRHGVSKVVGDHLHLGWNDFVSPAFFDLLNELEPGVHRAFAVDVISKEPIGGKTEHGTFYWMRPPPIIDCVLFPQTKTRADVHNEPWEKKDIFTPRGIAHEWGGWLSAVPPLSTDRRSKVTTIGGRAKAQALASLRIFPPGRKPCSLRCGSGS